MVMTPMAVEVQNLWTSSSAFSLLHDHSGAVARAGDCDNCSLLVFIAVIIFFQVVELLQCINVLAATYASIIKASIYYYS